MRWENGRVQQGATVKGLHTAWSVGCRYVLVQKQCILAHLSFLMSTWWTIGGGRFSCLLRPFRAEGTDVREGKWQRWSVTH